MAASKKKPMAERNNNQIIRIIGRRDQWKLVYIIFELALQPTT